MNWLAEYIYWYNKTPVWMISTLRRNTTSPVPIEVAPSSGGAARLSSKTSLPDAAGEHFYPYPFSK